MPMRKRALISVSDKTGIVEFARAPARASASRSFPPAAPRSCCARPASRSPRSASYTGFPEMLDGRVKTLHPEGPRRHPGAARPAGARRRRCARTASCPDRSGRRQPLSRSRRPLPSRDCTLEDAIENIDIGGPAMVRAAAKNYQHVAVVTDPADYPALLAEMQSRGRRDQRGHALRAGAEGVLAYRRLRRRDQQLPHGARRAAASAAISASSSTSVSAKVQDLRYGENPHQQRGVLPRPATGAGRARRATCSCRAKSFPTTTSPMPMRRGNACKTFDAAGLRHRQACQSVRRRDRATAARCLRQRFRDRSDLGFRRHHRLQPRARSRQPPRQSRSSSSRW